MFVHIFVYCRYQIINQHNAMFIVGRCHVLCWTIARRRYDIFVGHIKCQGKYICPREITKFVIGNIQWYKFNSVLVLDHNRLSWRTFKQTTKGRKIRKNIIQIIENDSVKNAKFKEKSRNLKRKKGQIKSIDEITASKVTIYQKLSSDTSWVR